MASGGRISTIDDGRARLRFDEGTSALLDGTTRLIVRSGTEAEFESGRAFVDVPVGEPFELATRHASLRLVDAQISIANEGDTLGIDIAKTISGTNGVGDRS